MTVHRTIQSEAIQMVVVMIQMVMEMTLMRMGFVMQVIQHLEAK
jgi:hypothetical protein